MQFLMVDVGAVFVGLFGFWVSAALSDVVRERVLLARRLRRTHGFHPH